MPLLRMAAAGPALADIPPSVRPLARRENAMPPCRVLPPRSQGGKDGWRAPLPRRPAPFRLPP